MRAWFLAALAPPPHRPKAAPPVLPEPELGRLARGLDAMGDQLRFARAKRAEVGPEAEAAEREYFARFEAVRRELAKAAPLRDALAAFLDLHPAPPGDPIGASLRRLRTALKRAEKMCGEPFSPWQKAAPAWHYLADMIAPHVADVLAAAGAPPAFSNSASPLVVVVVHALDWLGEPTNEEAVSSYFRRRTGKKRSVTPASDPPDGATFSTPSK